MEDPNPLTEEEIRELDEISLWKYRKGFFELCADRQRIVIDLHAVGILNDLRENERQI